MRMINVRKQIGDFKIVIEDLGIEENMIHGIIGANGCGKTTLLKLLSGILKPDSGLIDYGTLTMRDITITSQRPFLMDDSVYNNIIYPLKIRKQKINRNEILDYMERFGLSGKENQYARSLSSGERQKLSFARALIFHPKLMLIDETMANLDPDSISLFEKAIFDIQAIDPITWMIVSHQPAHIYRLCQKVHFMDEGKIVANGTPQVIYSKTGNPIIRKYLSKHIIEDNFEN